MLINLPPHRSLSFYIYDLRKHSLVQSVTALFNWYFRLSSERGERAKSWYHISVNSSFYPKLISINEWGGALIILSSASLLIFTLQSLWFGIKVEKAYISYWEGCLIDTSIFQASYANNFLYISVWITLVYCYIHYLKVAAILRIRHYDRQEHDWENVPKSLSH